jgi:uncharacterized protein YkwD
MTTLQLFNLLKLMSLMTLLILFQGCGLALPESTRLSPLNTSGPSADDNDEEGSFFAYLPSINKTDTFEQQLINLINAERISQGRPPLSISPLLMQVAEAHSQDMIDRNFFDHTNPDGLDPGDRLDNAGYHWMTWAENIGAGQTTAQEMFDVWMNSSGHRANILNGDVTEIGIGYATGGTYGHYWTAIFARPF